MKIVNDCFTTKASPRELLLIQLSLTHQIDPQHKMYFGKFSSFLSQSVLQVSEAETPAQLGMLNDYLSDVFGKNDALFMRTKPRELLFEGLPMCVQASGITKIICSVIKSRGIKAIREMGDDSLRFSLFNHVRLPVH